jgi:transcription antitermination factor NusG
MLMEELRTTAFDGAPPLPEPYEQPRWYAVYTSARHEKRVAAQLQDRSIDSLLPLYETVRRWKNGRVRLSLPLFPGYVFIRIALKDRLQVLKLPSVVRLVGFDGRPLPLSDSEVETVQACLSRGAQLLPHPFLTLGRRVRVIRGPLQGLEGIVVRKKSQFRIVVSMNLIQRSVSADVAQQDLLAVGN